MPFKAAVDETGLTRAAVRRALRRLKGPSAVVVIAVATEGDEEVAAKADDVIFIPATSRYLTPILAAIPLQLLAYHIGVLRGCDVDQPRNLAKSVTVE